MPMRALQNDHSFKRSKFDILHVHRVVGRTQYSPETHSLDIYLRLIALFPLKVLF